MNRLHADAGSGAYAGRVGEYSYMGVGTVVERNLPQPGTKLTYVQSGAIGIGGDQYVGLDRYGRIIDRRKGVRSSS